MGKYEILATISLSINVISFASIIYNLLETKNASSFTWTYLLGNIFGQILLIAYGLINKAWGIWMPTIFIFIGLIIIAYIKYNYKTDVIVTPNNNTQS
jgi:CHASE2 domain-containing sensor protein